MKNEIIYFQQIIRKHYPQESEKILSEMEINFKTIEKDVLFSKKPSNPIDKRMGIAGYFLSLVKTLDEKGEDFAQIRTISLEVAHLIVKPKNSFHAWLKKLPPKLISLSIMSWVLKKFHEKVSQNSHNEGFIANIITDKAETYGFGYGVDILECGICKLFNRYNYGKFVSILCEVDNVTSGLAGLTLIRTNTIANGAAKCDFRFIRT